jgi:hypothetical protein
VQCLLLLKWLGWTKGNPQSSSNYAFLPLLTDAADEPFFAAVLDAYCAVAEIYQERGTGKVGAGGG